MTTRERLLQTAEHLARTRGFQSFSYADLAKTVGISKPSVHHHFAAKSDLAHALISDYSTRFLERLADIPMSMTAANRLRAYLQLYRASLGKGDQICLCVAFAAGRDGFDDRTLKVLQNFHSQSLDWLADCFTLAQSDKSISAVADPATESAATLALCEGAQLLARAAASPAAFDAATAALNARLRPA